MALEAAFWAKTLIIHRHYGKRPQIGFVAVLHGGRNKRRCCERSVGSPAEGRLRITRRLPCKRSKSCVRELSVVLTHPWMHFCIPAVSGKYSFVACRKKKRLFFHRGGRQMGLPWGATLPSGSRTLASRGRASQVPPKVYPFDHSPIGPLSRRINPRLR